MLVFTPWGSRFDFNVFLSDFFFFFFSFGDNWWAANSHSGDDMMYLCYHGQVLPHHSSQVHLQFGTWLQSWNTKNVCLFSLKVSRTMTKDWFPKNEFLRTINPLFTLSAWVIFRRWDPIMKITIIRFVLSVEEMRLVILGEDVDTRESQMIFF